MSSAAASAPASAATPLLDRPTGRSATRVNPGWLAVAVAVALAASPAAQGYFDFEVWGAMALGLLVIIIVLLRIRRLVLTRSAAVAIAGLALLLGLSAASWLWAESREAVWTDTNRLTFYGAVFAIVVLAVRDSRTARLIIVVLGSAALVASLWLCVSMLLGGARGYFPGRRLEWPIGYVNANAGLLAMGFWPWLALAETARRSAVRAAALGAASLIASSMVLTQSRALIPAMLAATILVLICASGRTTRALNLLLVTASAAAALTWILQIYSSGGASARYLAPAQGLLRDAALSIAAAAACAAVVRLGFSRWAAHVGSRRTSKAQRRVGIALALMSPPLLVASAVIAAPSVSRQYHSFTAMRFNDAAPVRILDAGGYRYDLWRVAVREFERHPLAGIGAGNYDVEYYQLRHNPEYVLQPHSIELQTAAELGVVGLLAVLMFCGGVASACFASRQTLASGDRFVKLAAAGMFAAWLAGTSVDWLYDIPGVTGMAIVAAALLVLPRETPNRSLAGSGRTIWSAFGVVAVALLAASIGRQYAATQYTNLGTAKLSRRPAAAIANLRQASELDPYSLTALYGLSAAYDRQNDYPHARAALLAAAAREPHNFVPPALLGDLETRRGAFRRAGMDYARAVALDPHDRTVRSALELAQRTR